MRGDQNLTLVMWDTTVISKKFRPFGEILLPGMFGSGVERLIRSFISSIDGSDLNSSNGQIKFRIEMNGRIRRLAQLPSTSTWQHLSIRNFSLLGLLRLLLFFPVMLFDSPFVCQKGKKQKTEIVFDALLNRKLCLFFLFSTLLTAYWAVISIFLFLFWMWIGSLFQ